MTNWLDIEYELKFTTPENTNWEFFDDLSDTAIKNIAKKYRLDQRADVFNIVWNWDGKLTRKQRYLIIFCASECEKQFWK